MLVLHIGTEGQSAQNKYNEIVIYIQCNNKSIKKWCKTNKKLMYKG